MGAAAQAQQEGLRLRVKELEQQLQAERAARSAEEAQVRGGWPRVGVLWLGWPVAWQGSKWQGIGRALRGARQGIAEASAGPARAWRHQCRPN